MDRLFIPTINGSALQTPPTLAKDGAVWMPHRCPTKCNTPVTRLYQEGYKENDDGSINALIGYMMNKPMFRMFISCTGKRRIPCHFSPAGTAPQISQCKRKNVIAHPLKLPCFTQTGNHRGCKKPVHC